MRSALREIFTHWQKPFYWSATAGVKVMGSARTTGAASHYSCSLLGAMAAMLSMGFHQFAPRYIAIVLSVGLVVDDAIVVVENGATAMREGKIASRQHSPAPLTS